MKQIYEYQNALPEKERVELGLPPVGQDHSEITEIMRIAYRQDALPNRLSLFNKGNQDLQGIYKDQFYHKLMEDAIKVNQKQAEFFKNSKGKSNLVDSSLADLIHFFVS